MNNLRNKRIILLNDFIYMIITIFIDMKFFSYTFLLLLSFILLLFLLLHRFFINVFSRFSADTLHLINSIFFTIFLISFLNVRNMFRSSSLTKENSLQLSLNRYSCPIFTLKTKDQIACCKLQ